MIRDQIILRTPYEPVRAAALHKLQPTLDALSFHHKKSEKGGENAFKSCADCFHTHKRNKCKYRNAICHKCGKKGHIAVVYVLS